MINPSLGNPQATRAGTLHSRATALGALVGMLLLGLSLPGVAQTVSVNTSSLMSAWSGSFTGAAGGTTTQTLVTNPSTSGTFIIPTDTTNGMLVVTIAGEVDNTLVPTVTWGTSPMTRATFTTSGSNNGAGYSAIYYLASPTSGTGPLNVTFKGNRFSAYAVFATGVSQVSQPSASAVGNGAGTADFDTTLPTSITPTAGALVVTSYGASPSTDGNTVLTPKIVKFSNNMELSLPTSLKAGNATSSAGSGHVVTSDASPLKGRTSSNVINGSAAITIASFAPASSAVFSSLEVTPAATSTTAGATFNVTITAKNLSGGASTDSITPVTVSSPSSLMEFDWDNNNNFGDNSGVLVSGTKTIQARNKKAETTTITPAGGGATMIVSGSVTTTATSFTKLQILAPGETAAPGTTTGKTGTPTTRTPGVSFNVTVNAVDENWNPVTSGHTVGITSTDPSATLPADAALVAGTKTFALTLNNIAGGSFTATATNISNSGITASTTPVFPLTPNTFTWAGGASSSWDTSALNWTNPASATVAYVNGVTAAFVEAATNRTVNLVGTLTSAAVNVSNTTGAYTFGGTGSIDGATGLTKSGAGMLTISNANTYTGATTVSGGTLSVNTIADTGGTSAIGFGTLITLSGNGSTLSYTGAGLATTARGITISPGIPIIDVNNASGSLNLSGAINNSGSALSKNGSGTLILSGSADNNNLVLNVSAGEVQLAKDNTTNIRAVAGISGIANGATVKLIGPGNDQIFGGSNNASYGVNGMVAGGTLNLNGFSEGVSFLTGTGGVVEGGSGTPTLTVGQSDVSSTFSGVIQNTTGTLSLTKTGTGTFTLTNPSTYSGTTTVSGGTVNLNHNSAIQNSALVTAGGAATKLVLGTGVTAPTFGGLSGATGDLNATLITNYGLVTALTLNPLSGSVTYGGAITNGASAMTLTKTGAGTQILSGTNTYTGNTTISAGRLQVTGSLGATTVNVDAGTLAGNGNIGGNVNIASGATHELAVAATAGAQVTRAITGTLTLTSGNILSLTAAAAPALGQYVLATATVGIIGTPTTVNFSGVNGVVTVDTVSSPKRLLLTIGAITLTGAPITAVNTTYGTASPAPAQFSVAGAFLSGAPGNLTVTPPAGYEVSLSSGSGYTTSLAVPYSSATLASTPVFLRLAATATVAGSPYSGTISVSGGSAATQTIATVSSAVSTAPLTLTANSRSKGLGQTVTYGSGSTLFTSSGLKNGETIGSVTLASTGGTSGAGVGAYPITPSNATGGTFTLNNYTPTYLDGTLTVLGLNEYAFGTTNSGILVLNPNGTIATRGQAPIIQTTVGSSVVTLTYARLKNSGCTFGAEFSTNLNTWLQANDPALIYPPSAPVGETVFDNGDDMEVVSIKFPIFRNNGTGFEKMEQNFCRIAVTP